MMNMPDYILAEVKRLQAFLSAQDMRKEVANQNWEVSFPFVAAKLCPFPWYLGYRLLGDKTPGFVFKFQLRAESAVVLYWALKVISLILYGKFGLNIQPP